MRYLFIFLLSLTFLNMNSQENLPFYEIPDYPESYSEAGIVGRMIDGLGFRYYWATEGLTDTDLAYKLPNDSRSSMETIIHIYDLSNMILYTALNSPIEMMSTEGMGFKEIRKNTLLNLKQASDIHIAPNEKSLLPFFCAIPLNLILPSRSKRTDFDVC